MLLKEELIRRWTDALEDNAEQQLHAMGMLDEAIDSSAATIPESLGALQRVTPLHQKNRARILLFYASLVLILFAIIAFTTAKQFPPNIFCGNGHHGDSETPRKFLRLVLKKNSFSMEMPPVWV